MLRTATKDTLKYANVLTLTIVHLKQKCAYKHQKPSIDNDQVKINEKVEGLEKVVEALTQKVISLETTRGSNSKENSKQ